MIIVHVIIDEMMKNLDHKDHVVAHFSETEIIPVAVVAAKYFQNHQERALYVVQKMEYFSQRISVSRLNRRLHALIDWFMLTLETFGELAATFVPQKEFQ